jgi:glycine hydroxymethyltransferase
VSSGLRVGTPALATRGLDVDAFREVGKVIGEALTATSWTDEVQAELSERTRALAERFPLYRQAAATV